jgi:hypothetical protein
MASRTLTERELNRAVLARQLLLERATMPIPRALERMCGLQDQYAPNGYIGLWSRLANVRRDDLTRALRRKSVIQATLMRATIHLVSRRDYWPLFLAIQEQAQSWWLTATKRTNERPGMARLAKQARAMLADGPGRRAEIIRSLGIDAQLFNGLAFWLPTVRVPPSGTWEQRRADLYTTAEAWIGQPTGITDGAAFLVRRYLAAFGPATRKDIMSFTGFSAAVLTPVLDRLPLRSFLSEGGEELVDVRGAPLPPADTPAPVRFLPTWDATLLVHARRTQILPERYRPLVFNTKTPHGIAPFLVDGRVAGSWRHEDGRLRIDEFEPLPRPAKRAVESEAAALAAFHA